MGNNPNPQPNIIDLAQRFRKAIELQDAKAIKQLVDAYSTVENGLQDKIDLLLANIPEDATRLSILRLKAYKALVTHMKDDLTKFQSVVELNVRNNADVMLKMGISDAQSLAAAIAGEAINSAWVNINPNVVKNLTAFLDPEGQLFARIQSLAGSNATRVADNIITWVTAGNNPVTIAKLIKDDMGGSLVDAVRLTRTAQIYSYREANRASYIANEDIVPGWYWMSALDARSCPACIAMHGTFHTNDETLDDHYNGLCTMVPAVVGQDNPFGKGDGLPQYANYASGEDWFNAQGEGLQQSILGKSRFDAWQNGDVQLSDMVSHTDNEVYGQMIQVK